MNTILAELLRFLNAVVAICLIAGGAVVGNFYHPKDQGGVIVGLLGGFVVAVAFCGLLATLIDIRNRLGEIAENTRYGAQGRSGVNSQG